MGLIDDWANKEYYSRGLVPISSERELIRIASNIEQENTQLRKEIEHYKADLSICNNEAQQLAKKVVELRRELQQCYLQGVTTQRGK